MTRSRFFTVGVYVALWTISFGSTAAVAGCASAGCSNSCTKGITCMVQASGEYYIFSIGMAWRGCNDVNGTQTNPDTQAPCTTKIYNNGTTAENCPNDPAPGPGTGAGGALGFTNPGTVNTKCGGLSPA